MLVQDQKPKWAIHFNIDDNTWAKLAAQSGQTNLSPLEIALEMGIINHEKFLNWDRDTSKIPALKMDFFNSPPPMELFQKFNYQECRKKACMPVTEWSGNIYWAKLSSEKTGLEKDGSQPLWFLAPWAGLKKWFEAWKSVAVPTEIPALFVESPQPEAPAEIILEENGSQELEFGMGDPQPFQQEPVEQSQSKSFTGTELKMMPSLSINQVPMEFENPGEISSNEVFTNPDSKLSVRSERFVLEVVSPEKTAQPKSSVKNEPPFHENTFIEPQPETIILDEPLEGSTPVPQPTPKAEKPLRPESSSKALDPQFFSPRSEAAQDPIEKISIPKPEASAKQIDPPTGLNQFNPEVTAAIDFSSLMGAPIPPLPMAKAPPAPQIAVEPTVIQTPEAPPLPPTPAEHPPIVSMPAVPPPVEAIKIDPVNLIPTVPLNQFESRMRLATTQEALAETFMGTWQNYFQQVMILLFQNTQLCIWWHNNQFNGQFKRGEVIPLDTPSVFKIVADTCQPYHGYVSRGPVNDQFFQVVNAGQYPDHLTIVPVVSDDHVVAMLLGECNLEMAKAIILPKLEEDARLFSNSLMKTSSFTKKVA